VVDRGGLENRYTRKGIGGSNPLPSASFSIASSGRPFKEHPMKKLLGVLAILTLFAAPSFAQEQRTTEYVATAQSTLPPYGVMTKEVMPTETHAIVTQYQKTYDSLSDEVIKNLVALNSKTAAELAPLQDKYMTEKKLDEAVAVRNAIRQLRATANYSSLKQLKTVEVGKKFKAKIIADGGGVIYGTDIYSSDSNPGTAAIHAGLLKEGEEAELEFEIVKGLESWPSTTRNGVTSWSYGPWPTGYRISKPASP
jgi:hypothetical protein